MKLLSTMMTLLAAFKLTAFAGGPEFEADKIHIDAVKTDHRGVVLTVTGTGKLFVSKPDHEMDARGNASWVALRLSQAEIVCVGDELHAVRFDKTKAWQQRLLGLVGKDVHLQAWGISATIEGGQISRIFARHVWPIAPTLEESRFKYDDLEKLSASPDK
jgi:hypothetical protein